MSHHALSAPAPAARLSHGPPPGGEAPGRAASLADLTWLNVADILAAFGLPRALPLRGLAELAAREPARRFARQIVTMDGIVGAAGLQAGGAWICGQLSGGVELRGGPPPADGPLLIVANHPGLVDAAALFSAIPRADLRVLAIARPFLRSLPNIAARLFAVGDSAASRTAAVRAAARHLRSGGALLTFPAGRIEPDPLYHGAAADAVGAWSDSVNLLARLAGDVTVLPMIVGGVISPAAMRHPIARLRRRPADRQWLAAILQLMLPRLRGGRVRVQIGGPIAAAGGEVHSAVAAEARRLIAEVALP
jgi:1-acyl-sn-glycerol-3-phosphate acyltransferase